MNFVRSAFLVILAASTISCAFITNVAAKPLGRESALVSFRWQQETNADQFTLSGRVTSPDGPVVGARVFYDCCATEWGVLTDTDGVYQLTTEGAQDGSLMIVPPIETKLSQGARQLTIVDHMEGVDFHLLPGRLLAGRITNKNGVPAELDRDLFSPDGVKRYVELNSNAEFMLYLSPDTYSLVLYSSEQSGKNHTINLRTDDVPTWEVQVDVSDNDLTVPSYPAADELPPLVEHIMVGAPNIDGIVHIVGASGAVPGGIPYVDIVNLHIGSFVSVAVNEDGSFQADLLAPYGSALQFRLNRREQLYQKASGIGAIIWVFPSEMRDPSGNLRVHLVGAAGKSPGYWTATGTIDNEAYNPGDSMAVSLDVTIEAPDVDERFDSGDYKLVALLNAERFFEKDGRHRMRVQRGASTTFTPLGLPLESMSSGRGENYTPLSLRQEVTITASNRIDNRLNFHIEFGAELPASLSSGYYRPALQLLLGDENYQAPLPSGGPLGRDEGFEERAELSFNENTLPAYLPVIRIGDPEPPNIPWSLLSNTFSNGARGTVAIEERDRVGVSNRIAFQPERLIVPRTTWYGQPITYRLEPFVPTLSSSLASDVEPFPPMIPLVFPGGSLEVSVTDPNGNVEALGPTPLRQMRNGIANDTWNYYIGGDRSLQKLYEVTTLSDQFLYHFDDYGHYSITMHGTLEDVWGNVYDGGGTYDIWVANVLDLEPAVFPGQPFEVGDTLATSVVVQPSVPATVTVDFVLLPEDGLSQTYSVTGAANRFGHYQPVDEPYSLLTPGEYLMDVTAEYWDDEGVLWMGVSRGAGVVESPDSPLTAHGLRGVSSFPHLRPGWFLASQIHPSGAKENEAEMPEDQGFMMLYPYHSGDILWMSDQHNSIIAELSIHDNVGWYEDILLSRWKQMPWVNRTGIDLEERAKIGELPLVTTTHSGYDWSLIPEDVDQWGYAYISTQKPGISVRGFTATDNLLRTYWSTDYKYDRQLGNGLNGDVANDVKLHFGGAVIRTEDNAEYLGYASMEVLVPFADDSLGIRTLPPFQGFSGGPDGGPIMTLKGEDVNLFLTPTALRPGSILDVGDSVSVAGTMWPTLNSTGLFTFTAPSGRRHIVQGQANRFGYYFPSEETFIADEAGRWMVEASLRHDAVVPSTGAAPAGKNTGSLLGASACNGWSTAQGCGQFYLYVVPADEPMLELDIPRLQRIPPPASVTFEGDVPNGWTQASGSYTVVMSGYILQEGDLAIDGDRFLYTFDPWELHKEFPNLDITTPSGAVELVDTMTFSFMLSGIDAHHQERYQARSIVMQGQQFQALPHGPREATEKTDNIYLPIIVR